VKGGLPARAAWLGATLLVAATVVFIAARGVSSPAPSPPGTFSFAALGDAPYFPWEDLRYRFVLQDLDAHELGFVLHVGDIFWRPCSEENYGRSLRWFNGLRHPVLFTPGDNEWSDCWETRSGAHAPLDRLARIRRIFFEHPTHSLGGRPLTLVRQATTKEFPEFVENARWTHEGLVFATVHLVGSKNGGQAFAGRTAADDEAAPRRTEAAAAWLRETFAEASAANAPAVVVGFHADPDFEAPVEHAYRRAYEPFVEVLEEEVERFGKPVLVVHGDDHHYRVDHPLTRRTTGRTLRNLTRLEVPGSPEVGWVRIVVRPGADSPFTFEERVVPRWKLW